MATAATRTPEQQEAAELDADACLEMLLVDGRLDEFEFTDWNARSEARTSKFEEFTEKVFPLLAKYFQGIELATLTTGHQWLTDLSHPSKRSSSARDFHADPVRNLTVLAVFLKLQVLRIYGTGLVQQKLLWHVCLEMMKIVEASRSSLTVEYWKYVQDHPQVQPPVSTGLYSWQETEIDDKMRADFGEKWDSFKR